jgi:hypothetical protein
MIDLWNRIAPLLALRTQYYYDYESVIVVRLRIYFRLRSSYRLCWVFFVGSMLL